MDWSINISKAENGYICEWYEEVDDGHYSNKKQWVIEEKDTEYGELDAMKYLLHLVKEHFGIYHSKHNKFNLYVEVKEREEQEQVVDSTE